MRKIIDPKTGRDVKYQLIRVMYDDRHILVFRDIFKFIPKTTVSNDLGYRVDRFNVLLDHLDQFPLRKLFELAGFCELTEAEILKLVTDEREAKRLQGNTNQ